VPAGDDLSVTVAGETLSLPVEFLGFTGPISSTDVRDARASATGAHALLAQGRAVVLRGEFRYVDGVFRLCQRMRRQLVPAGYFREIGDHRVRKAAYVEEGRRRLHRLLVEGDGGALPWIEGAPAMDGFTRWFDGGVPLGPYLIPYRRLQRILTDMRRAREGVMVEGIGESLTVHPHVYVPSDASVPAMYARFASLLSGRDVLDMGTGTGVLAILAANLGARSVVATDISPEAVANARENVRRTNTGATVCVKDAAPLFQAVDGGTFDVVMFNAPWIDGEPRTRYDTARYDPGFGVLSEFLAGCAGRLRPGGAALVQLSDIGRAGGADPIALLVERASASGLTVASTASIDRRSRTAGGTETVYVFELRAKDSG
jgi:SAM-dependent methyltransferase